MTPAIQLVEWAEAQQQLTETIQSSQSETTAYYLSKAYADNTYASYKTDLIHFIRWTGHPDPFPTTTELVLHYLTCFAQELAPSTLQHRVAALSFIHRLRGLYDPTQDYRVKGILRGIRKDKTEKGWQKKQAATINLNELKMMIDAMSDSLRDARDKALLLTGLIGAFRPHELATLKMDQLYRVDGAIVISLGQTKNDQLSELKKFKVLPSIEHQLCPVRALDHWLQLADIKTGNIFRGISRHGKLNGTSISHPTLNGIIKKWTGIVDSESNRYFSGNTLRASFITIARQLNIPDPIITKQTLHQDLKTLCIYDRPEMAVKDSPAITLLEALKNIGH